MQDRNRINEDKEKNYEYIYIDIKETTNEKNQILINLKNYIQWKK